MTLSNDNKDVTLFVVVTLKSIQCKYFEEASDTWKTTGCSVVNSTTDSTVCRCNRVAQFGVSEMPVFSEFNFQPIPVRQS